MEIDENGEDVRLSEIFSQLDEKVRRELDNRMCSYYNKTMQTFIYVGNFWLERPAHLHDIPDARNHMLHLKDVNLEELQFKFRDRAKGEHSDALINGQAEMSKGSRRTKERKIGEVILAVKKWRELYTVGEKQTDQSFKQLSLEEAAIKVGISKKSLDDYFLQLK